MPNSNIPPSAWHNLFILAGIGLMIFLIAAGAALIVWADAGQS